MLKITPNPNTVKHVPAAHGGIFSIKNPDEKIIDFSSNVNPLGCCLLYTSDAADE